MAKERKSSPRRKPRNRKTRAAQAAAGAADREKTENQLGRPHALTTKRIDDICMALGLCSSIKDAAAYAGVSEKTYHRWMERARHAFEAAGLDPEEPPSDWEAMITVFDKDEVVFCRFRQRATRARAEAHIGLLGAAVLYAKGGPLFDEAGNVVANVDGDGRVALQMLSMRDNEYAQRKKHEMSGPEGEPVGVVIYMPEEEDEP